VPASLDRPSGSPLWFESTPRRERLSESIDADVAIVGAGYTGLWTAYYLLRTDPSVRVAILERHHAGFGASGRNGGWASAILPVSLPHIAKASSWAEALALQEAMNDTVDEIGRVLDEEGVDADYAKNGFVSLARTAAHERTIRPAVQRSAAIGLPHQWQALDRTEAAGMVGARGVRAALFTEHCALIHPGKLVRGLASAVERLGGRIYEDTTAVSLERGRVVTTDAVVRAPVVVRATEGFTPQLAAHRRTIVPLYSLLLATEPLPRELLERFELTTRRAYNDMRHLRIYAQTTRDGRVAFGGRGAPYHWNSRVAPAYDTNERIHRKIHATMLDFFPELAGVAITHRWGGPLGVARDWFPSVGLDRTTGQAWAGSYVGDGVATSNLAGRILSRLVLERDDELTGLPLVDHRSPTWEPEPLRWLGVNSGLLAASLADVEENLTRRPSVIARILESLTGAH